MGFVYVNKTCRQQCSNPPEDIQYGSAKEEKKSQESSKLCHVPLSLASPISLSTSIEITKKKWVPHSAILARPPTAPLDRMAFDGCAVRLAPGGPCFMRGWPSKRSGLDHWKRPGPLSPPLPLSLPPSLSFLCSLPLCLCWPCYPTPSSSPAGPSWPIMPGIYCVCAAVSLLLTHVAARQSCRPATLHTAPPDPVLKGQGGSVPPSPHIYPMPGHQGDWSVMF